MTGLRERREALGWTQAQLAAVAETLQAYVSAFERGRAVPARARTAVEDALLVEERSRAEVARREVERGAHRDLAASMPESPEWRALRAAMGARAMALLDANQCEACDAILEFLTEAEVTELLDRWLDEQMPVPADTTAVLTRAGGGGESGGGDA